MDTPLKLSVLDLCKRAPNESAGEALWRTVALAELADRLGFHRFWVAEHHVDNAAHACPEVLVGLIAAHTRRIRVGAGGILLRYGSPLKVAETFLALAALFPGRIDLGVCWGPGVADAATALALVDGNRFALSEAAFERKLHELVAFLGESAAPTGSNAARVRAKPGGVVAPALWVLGSGGGSAELAAASGAPYALALFLGGRQADAAGALPDPRGMAAIRGSAPVAIAVSVVCAETDARAHRRQAQLVAHGYTPSNIVGSPAECARQIEALRGQYQVDEVIVTCFDQDQAARTFMCMTLAEAVGLANGVDGEVLAVNGGT